MCVSYVCVVCVVNLVLHVAHNRVMTNHSRPSLLVMRQCLMLLLSVCLCVCPSACLYVCLSVCLPACLPVCLSICLYVCLAVCLSVSLVTVIVTACMLTPTVSLPIPSVLFLCVLRRSLFYHVSELFVIIKLEKY